MNNTFSIPIIPENDNDRVAAIKRYSILQSRDILSLSHYTELAAHLFDVPISLISIVDKEHVLFKSNYGMEGTYVVDRGKSLCSLAILKDEVTLFKNAIHDPCLLANPLVHGEFGLRFYAGAPLVTKDKYRIGTLCIVGHEPREFKESEQKILLNMAATVMEEIEKSRD